jgi:hypothetical protein
VVDASPLLPGLVAFLDDRALSTVTVASRTECATNHAGRLGMAP